MNVYSAYEVMKWEQEIKKELIKAYIPLMRELGGVDNEVI